MASTNKTKRPEDTTSRHLWLINYGERTSTSTLALGYSLPGYSRHVRVYYCNDPFHHDTRCSTPYLILPSWAIPVVLDCSRPLVGVDTKSSEVVQETPHPLFFLLPPRTPCPPPILQTSSTSAVSCPPCAPQIPRTRFASCA